MKQILVMLSWLAGATLCHAESLDFATDPWCPYVCDIHTDKPGILIEANDLIFAETQYSPQYIILNWAQAINLARKGDMHAVMGAYRSDVPDFVFGTEAFLASRNCFFVAQSSDWQYESLLSLTERRIAFMNGYSYGPLMDNYILNNENSGEHNLMRISGDEDIARRIKLLRHGRINTIVEDKQVFTWFAQQDGYAKQFKSAGCLTSQDVHIAFSPSLKVSPALAKILDNGIRRLQKSGQLQQIIDRYQTVE